MYKRQGKHRRYVLQQPGSCFLCREAVAGRQAQPFDDRFRIARTARLSKKTDINSHPHQLRHYFAEERRKEGWDLNDIRFALGHKKVETTIKYLGENNERLVEATDQYYSNNENLYQIAEDVYKRQKWKYQ